jgi:ABC-type transport system involved in multi-copper enzyme maturation permease subunit
MTAVLTIARLTVGEAARRRILWVLLALTLVSVGLTGWGVERLVALARASGAEEIEIRIAISQILILVAFMFSFVLAMTAAFLGAPAVASDLESGVAQAILVRPIRRADLLVGRWLGLAGVVVAYAVASGLLEIAVVRLVSGHAPPEPLLAVAYLAAEAIVVLTLAILLSTRLPAIAAGAVCVVVFGLAWMAGVFAGIGAYFDADALVAVAEASRWLFPTDGLWRGAVFGLEPPIVVLVAAGRLGTVSEANPFFAAAPPPIEFVAWSTGWVALVLVVAIRSFARRDL